MLPFLLISLLGDNTMLAKAPDNRVIVVLCTGTEQVEMVWAEDGSLKPADDPPAKDHDSSNACEWTTLAQQAVTAEPSDAPDFEPVLLTNRMSIGQPLHARRMAVLAPSARGPPLLA
ncbi:hypothetical protein C9E81_08675 [Paracoccus alkanivorans]|uniref:DUF2946 domain-containing protein n=2 Tax=Paracoccus alkanivorans TaxID=2116655 RepID=A0A3M0MC25_9RHOB|nr:hypothetical protein C9E81_08675 [Paracoccus alkanivorans]